MTDTITIEALEPSTSLSIDRSQVPQRTTINLSWTSQNAASCSITMSGTLIQGGLAASGTIAHVVRNPKEVYTLDCRVENQHGAQATQTAASTLPEVKLLVNEILGGFSIHQGAAIILGHQGLNYDSCVFAKDIVPISGNTDTLMGEATYAVTCQDIASNKTSDSALITGILPSVKASVNLALAIANGILGKSIFKPRPGARRRHIGHMLTTSNAEWDEEPTGKGFRRNEDTP